MPRNGSGTMSIPNSFTSGTTAQSAQVNANFTDIASEITSSLPRDGQAAMTGQLKSSSGTAAAPGVTFSSDLDCGLYRASADTIGMAVGGAVAQTWSTSGTTFPGTVADVNGTLSPFYTGFLQDYMGTTAPSGWVLASGLTIGNASSSATGRANADTVNLFTLLWESTTNSELAVSSGRGASAAADYAANKTIALPDLRGRARFGKDDMGGTTAGRITSALSSIVGTVLGAFGGAESLTMVRANLPSFTLSVTGTVNSTPSPSTWFRDPGNQGVEVGPGTASDVGSNETMTINSTFTGGVTANVNGGVTQTAMNKMPPAYMVNVLIKL
jgi:microcystin-dependent protein